MQRGIERKQDRLACFFGDQLADKVDLLADIHHRLIDIGSPLQLDDHQRSPKLRRRGDPLDVFNRGYGRFDASRHQSLDLFGANACVVADDGDGGEFEFGKQVEFELRKRKHPKPDDHQIKHRKGDGPPNGHTRKRAHACVFLCLGAFGRMLRCFWTNVEVFLDEEIRVGLHTRFVAVCGLLGGSCGRCFGGGLFFFLVVQDLDTDARLVKVLPFDDQPLVGLQP